MLARSCVQQSVFYFRNDIVVYNYKCTGHKVAIYCKRITSNKYALDARDSIIDARAQRKYVTERKARACSCD